MTRTIYWFRTDLRLADNPAFHAACGASTALLPVHVASSDETADTVWGFPRWGPHRRRFRDQALTGLRTRLRSRGSDLLIVEGDPVRTIAEVARQAGADRVVCETIAAPEEADQLKALRSLGLRVDETWQSSLIDPEDFPFGIPELPAVFTPFRKSLDKAAVTPRASLPIPASLPPLPGAIQSVQRSIPDDGLPDPRASFPFDTPAFDGAETAAQAHVARYFDGPGAGSYKATRDGLSGPGYSTKLSPWLAVGALSPRTVFEHLKGHEARHGVSEGSDWIRVELLWRDYFRFWSLKHGASIFRHHGLSALPRPDHDQTRFESWCAGQTGQAFVDAGMRELAATGFLSNRLRQVVASYLIHDLDCDWRAGAAWFESRLIDYDVCSNQGNWLYIAGRGADPRNGRRFDPDQQAAHHDADRAYRMLWSV